MIDLTTTLVVAILPFGLLALALLQKSFRAVLKSVFTDSDSSSVIALGNQGATASKRPAYEKSLRASLIAERRRQLALQRKLEDRVAQGIAEAVVKAGRADGEVIITIRGEREGLVGLSMPSHSGKHALGGLVMERKE